MDKDSEDLYERYKRLVPRTKDLVLILLKGHLLLEEQLFAYIADGCRSKRLLREARLTYAQKAKLVEAMEAAPANEIWSFVRGVNSLRNHMAHNLEIPDLPDRVDSILREYWKEGFQSPHSDQRRATVLRQTIGIVCTYLAGFADGHARG